jgi:hypothetical protein
VEYAVEWVPHPGFDRGSPAKSLEHDKGTLRVSGGRKAYRSWETPTWLGFRMSFIPAVPDFCNSSLLTARRDSFRSSWRHD